MNLGDKIAEAFASVISQFIQALPRLMAALFLLFLGWVLAKIFASMVSKMLRRLGLDRLANRLNQSPAFRDVNLSLRPVVIIRKFLYWTIFLIFALSATEVLGLPILTEQVSGLINFIPKLLTALVILAGGFYVVGAIREILADTCKSFGLSSWKFISSAVFFVLMLVVGVTALEQVGIRTDVLTTNEYIILGGIILGFAIAYGYAARNILASILSGFYSRGHFHLGQRIEIDEYVGNIVSMNKVSVTLDTGSKQIVFPLNRLLSDTIIIHKPKA